MKKIYYILIFILVSSVLYFLSSMGMTKTKIIPYPYEIVKKYKLELKKIQSSQVLIIGDQFANKLSEFKEIIEENISSTTQAKIKIYSISQKNEGLHRTIKKLKQLEKLPPVIIYLGGSEEFFEQKFYIKNYKDILINFKKYDNYKIASAVTIFPFLSRFIYKRHSTLTLNRIKHNSTLYPIDLKQKQHEIEYLLFENEIKELFEIIKRKKSKLIVITPPINLFLPPNRICENSQTEQIIAQQMKALSLLNKGYFKESLNLLDELKSDSMANAQTYYLLGKNNWESGNFNLAISNFEKATAYDCNPNHANILLILILQKYANRYSIPLIDFYDYLKKLSYNKEMFSEKHMPQNIFFEEISKIIAKKIKDLLLI